MTEPAPESLESLRESRRRLATLLSNLPGMVYRCRNDRDWTMEFISEGSLALTGHRAEDILNANPPFSDLLVPEEREPVWNYVQKALAARVPFTITYRMLTASGELRWVWEQGRGIFGEDGAVVAIEGFITDITERRSAEERVRRLNRLYSVLTRINEAIVRIRDPGALFTEACRIIVEYGRLRLAWVALRDPATDRVALGASFGDVDGLLGEVFGGDVDADLNLTEGHVARALASASPEIVAGVAADPRPEPWRDALCTRGLHTAAAFPLLVSGRVIGSLNLYADDSVAFDDEEQRLLFALTADLAFALELAEEDQRRQLLESDLARARSIETIGRLAGGLAHDFNNLVMIIGTCAENLRCIGQGDPALLREVEEIQRACARGTDLTRRLLAFGRRRADAPGRLDLGLVVVESQEMLSRLLGNEVEVRVTIEEGDHPVIADRNQIEQILLNLALNARDAMPEGGRLSFRVDAVTARRPMGGPAAPEGPCVRLAVEDTGPGLAPEIRAHLFEPFFSTKGAATGSGLGLASIQEVVRRGGGWIVATDALQGSGARFEIHLPRAGPVSASSAAAAAGAD
jgi:PAS domain S-box-containing protein